ncbi:MAG: hypothetical protein H6R18_949 [Proteobacteria bacterium]|nr:hypothetical protein [Pseudomonadota bacterium]
MYHSKSNLQAVLRPQDMLVLLGQVITNPNDPNVALLDCRMK